MKIITEAEAIGSHESLVDDYNSNRSYNVKHPRGCIYSRFLVRFAGWSHLSQISLHDFCENLYPSASMKIGSHLHKSHGLQKTQRNTLQIEQHHVRDSKTQYSHQSHINSSSNCILIKQVNKTTTDPPENKRKNHDQCSIKQKPRKHDITVEADLEMKSNLKKKNRRSKFK